MTLETFFEKFDQLADSSNAVARMRELILQLAAHGKLVEQSSDDEPASALVGRIEKYVAELRSRKEFRGLPVEPLDREELPGIPSTWEWVRLGNVVDYGSSGKAESADIPEDAWLLDLEDIEKDTSRLLQRKSFRDSPSKSTKTAFAVGDVLYGKLRPYLNKVLVADAPGYCTTEIIPIRAFGFIDPVYLCHALKRPEFIAYANSKSYGMNLPRLSTEDARNAPFPLPPLAEQKRIVAKVDELMALCDRLEAQQQERETRHAALARASLARFGDAPTPANLNFLFHDSYAIDPADLRKSILTLAVQGKLVPQDPGDESGTILIERIRSEREDAARERKVSPMKPLPSIEGDELTFEIPSGWIVARLIELVMEIQTGPFGSSLHKSDYVSGGTPVINPASLQDGRIIPSGEMAVGADTLARLQNFKLRADDIVMARRGEMGRCAVVTRLEDGWLCGTGSLVLRMPRSMHSPYLALLIGAPEAREYLGAASVGTTMQNLNQSILAKMPVGVPPLAEQRRIVAKVDQLMALVGELETQLTSTRATAAKLMEAVVAELTT
mgnify:CR=1 FL=1